MSSYKQAKEEADKYDPALCLAAMELLHKEGFIDRDSNPVFVRSSTYEDRNEGIDMHMLNGEDHIRLAFRTCMYIEDNILIRDKEMEKIRTGRYKADFFIIGAKNPEDYSLSAVRIVDIKKLLAAEKHAIEYDALIESMIASPLYLEINGMSTHLFGEKRPDKRNNNTSYYLAPINLLIPYCYFQTSHTGPQRRAMRSNPALSYPSYRARGDLPNIFLSMEYYEEACVLSACDDFKLEEYTWKP
jgi:hypothetical protein